jgi:hypothetical protein
MASIEVTRRIPKRPPVDSVTLLLSVDEAAALLALVGAVTGAPLHLHTKPIYDQLRRSRDVRIARHAFPTLHLIDGRGYGTFSTEYPSTVERDLTFEGI